MCTVSVSGMCVCGGGGGGRVHMCTRCVSVCVCRVYICLFRVYLCTEKLLCVPGIGN